MSNVLFAKGKQGILDNSLDMSGDIRVALVKSTYVFDASDITAADMGNVLNGTNGPLQNKTYTDGVFDADDVTLTAIDAVACNALVIYEHKGASASNWVLIAYIDTPQSGLPFTPTAGQTVNIEWDSGASKIFAL
jgi:hypothetical protein